MRTLCVTAIRFSLAARLPMQVIQVDDGWQRQALRDLYRLYRDEIGEDSYLMSCTGFNRATVGLSHASRIGPDSCALWNASHA